MNNAGVYELCGLQINNATTSGLLTPTTDLDGMTGCSLVARFRFGSGAGTVTAIVVTSVDGGSSLLHLARFEFTTVDATKYANLNGLLSKDVTAYADLVASGVNDGLLGNWLAVLLTTTGSYVGTTLDIRASVR